MWQVQGERICMEEMMSANNPKPVDLALLEVLNEIKNIMIDANTKLDILVNYLQYIQTHTAAIQNNTWKTSRD